MRLDVYSIPPDDRGIGSPTLQLDNLQPGRAVSMDGIDGFFDQHFEGKPVGYRERFIVVSADMLMTPMALALAEFERLKVVEAVIIESWPDAARVRIDRVSLLREWVIHEPLGPDDALEAMPELLRPLPGQIDEFLRSGQPAQLYSDSHAALPDSRQTAYRAVYMTSRSSPPRCLMVIPDRTAYLLELPTAPRG